MITLPRWVSGVASLSGLCLTVIAVAPLATDAQIAQPGVFPDVPSNYWAQPFIRGLAERDILSGYPDGRFRPEQTIERDELAAVIRKAFEREPVRQIESGSAFKDVPDGYWASDAIEEAYQQGFMSAYPDGSFRPRQNVSKVNAIVALTNAVDLPATPQATTQPTRQRSQARRPRFFFPLAITSLMQPLFVPKAQAAPPATTPTTPGVRDDRPASEIVANAYTDANRIPKSAIPNVAEATKANVVVNYPNPKVLNPTQPASRAEIAALVYQALVAQGRAEPIAVNTPAYQYIVRTDNNTQNAQ